MSGSTTVTLQVGQCGNQLGAEFFSLVSLWQAAEGGVGGGTMSSPFTSADEGGFLRAIAVDTEPKVIRNLASNPSLKYRLDNLVSGRYGRGSNWAMGYYLDEYSGYRTQEQLIETCLERVRKECERCDFFTGCQMIHSLAGGTGSGLGARLAEQIREQFLGTSGYLTVYAVCPHSSGESPLQSYNSLLCCSHLLRDADLVCLLHNDHAIYYCSQQHQAKGADKCASFADVNRHLASCLGGMLLPTDSLIPTLTMNSPAKGPRQMPVDIGMEPLELIKSIAPLPTLKLARIDGCYRLKSAESWDTVVSSLGNSIKSTLMADLAPTSAITEHRIVSAVAVFRGTQADKITSNYQLVKDRFPYLKFISWNPFPLDVWQTTRPFPHTGAKSSKATLSRCLTLCTNNTSSLEFLACCAQRARLKFNQGAYLHHFAKYGCHKEHFEEAFETLETTFDSYRDAVRS